MEGRLLARARAKLEAERQEHKREEYRRLDEVMAAIPEIRAINSRIHAIMPELVGLALGVKGRSAEEMAAESLQLQERRARLLRQHGYGEHYLDEIFSCPLCRDSGYLENGQICRCLMTLYKQEQTLELSPLLKNGDESFENFRPDYYSPLPLREGEPSPRSQMERVYQYCRRYAENFGAEGGGNLLFTGEPGLGKTFLSACIARVVSETGHSVVYDTAAHIFERFEAQKFSRDETGGADEDVSRLLRCDLLIIDDLGTELTTEFVRSAFYQIVNTHLMTNKKTIISTNLSPAELSRRYGANILSRIEGAYRILPFFGDDIRKQKK